MVDFFNGKSPKIDWRQSASFSFICFWLNKCWITNQSHYITANKVFMDRFWTEPDHKKRICAGAGAKLDDERCTCSRVVIPKLSMTMDYFPIIILISIHHYHKSFTNFLASVINSFTLIQEQKYTFTFYMGSNVITYLWPIKKVN